MKDKKKTILITALIIILVIAFILFINKRHNITLIEYSYNEDSENIIEKAIKYITIKEDGTVIFSNSYNSYTETMKIEKNEFDELKDYIDERFSIFEKKKENNVDSLNADTFHIEVKLKNGTIYKIDDNKISDTKTKEIHKKLISIVGRNNLNKYEDNIAKEKSDSNS